MSIYFPLLFAFMALFFLYIGVKVVASKKPLLLSAKVFFMFMVLAFSPQLMNLFEMHSSEVDIGLIAYLSPLLFIVLLGFFWIQMKGYMAIGISDDSLRNSLHYALNQNNIQFVEQLSSIKLTDIDAELQVAVQDWVGTGQLKLKKSKDKYLMAGLVSGMDEYFTLNNVEPNNTTPIFYIVIGLIMLMLSGYLFFL